MLLIVAVIHFMPVIGVLGSTRLVALYGIQFDDANLVILMRHRAVLFGLLGAFLSIAAFRPELQLLALIAGFVSVASFMLIAWSVGGYNSQIARVFLVDVIALICLAVGAAAYLISHRQTSA